MKTIATLGMAVTASLALMQPAEAGSRGNGRSFSSSPHFSGSTPRFSAPSRSFSNGPARTFTSAPRFHSPTRFSSGPTFRNRSTVPSTTRFSGTNRFRTPDSVVPPSRFNGDRTTAFNTRNRPRQRFSPNQTSNFRQPGVNRERIVGRYGANWNRHWDRRRDHWWRGRRCHFHNNVWVIYEPFFWYPYSYGYGYYPYGSYADTAYYDDGYAADQYSQSAYTTTPEFNDAPRVSEVQSALAREGYYDGAIDGRMGAATRRALRRYQADHGLEATGTINRALIEALQLR